MAPTNTALPKTALATVAIVLGFVLGLSPAARAQSEITLLAPMPVQESMDKLVAGFEAKTGMHVKVTYGSGLGTRKQVASGQALDVSVLFAPFPDALATGNIVPTSATVIARLRLGIAVKKGAPKPDISTPEAVKKMLLDAKSVVAVDPAQGSAGAVTLATLDKLGITDQLKPKITWVRGAAAVQDAVAKGERRDCAGSLPERNGQSGTGHRGRVVAGSFAAGGHYGLHRHQCHGPQSRQAASGLSGVAGSGGDLQRRADIPGPLSDFMDQESDSPVTACTDAAGVHKGPHPRQTKRAARNDGSTGR